MAAAGDWNVTFQGIPPETQAERRERIAVQIMAGLAANSSYDPTADNAARVAIDWADALMAELDKRAAEDAQETEAEPTTAADPLLAFVEQVRAEAHEDPELYGPFVRLVRDLDAKVGAK